MANPFADAHPFVFRSTRHRVVFPLFLSDNTPADGLDPSTDFTVEVMTDTGGFSAASNTPVILGSDNMYAIDLTSGETNGRCIMVKASGTGLLTQEITLNTYDVLMVTSNAIAGAANNATVELDPGASSVAGAYIGMYLLLFGGTSAGQYRQITLYNGATHEASVSEDFDDTSDATSYQVILPPDVPYYLFLGALGVAAVATQVSVDNLTGYVLGLDDNLSQLMTVNGLFGFRVRVEKTASTTGVIHIEEFDDPDWVDVATAAFTKTGTEYTRDAWVFV